jgi:hypothetical protein
MAGLRTQTIWESRSVKRRQKWQQVSAEYNAFMPTASSPNWSANLQEQGI